MKKALVWIALALVLIFNHSISTFILEDTQLVTAMGVDYEKGNRVKGTAVAPFYPPTVGAAPQPINVYFTAVSHNVQGLTGQFRREAQRKLVVGRLNTFLFSKELAEHGLTKVIDPLQRNNTIGRDINLAVVDGSTEQLLTASYPSAQIPARYLHDLLQNGLKNLAPQTDLHTFLKQLDGFGQDPFLPIIERKHKHIRYKGLALFKGDQYVGKLSFKDGYIFKTAYESARDGFYEIRYKDHYISIMNIQSKVNYKFSGPQDAPRLTIRLSVNGVVTDAAGLKLDNQKRIEIIENEWKKELTADTERVVKKLQELEVDSLGIGSKAASHYRNFKKENWKEQYLELPVKVEVKVDIKDAGITE